MEDITFHLGFLGVLILFILVIGLLKWWIVEHELKKRRENKDQSNIQIKHILLARKMLRDNIDKIKYNKHILSTDKQGNLRIGKRPDKKLLNKKSYRIGYYSYLIGILKQEGIIPKNWSKNDGYKK